MERKKLRLVHSQKILAMINDINLPMALDQDPIKEGNSIPFYWTVNHWSFEIYGWLVCPKIWKKFVIPSWLFTASRGQDGYLAMFISFLLIRCLMVGLSKKKPKDKKQKNKNKTKTNKQKSKKKKNDEDLLLRKVYKLYIQDKLETWKMFSIFFLFKHPPTHKENQKQTRKQIHTNSVYKKWKEPRHLFIRTKIVAVNYSVSIFCLYYNTILDYYVWTSKV